MNDPAQCFRGAPVGPRPVGPPLVVQRPLYVEPMLEVSDKLFPISIEERAKQFRAEMRNIGITTPDVIEP